MAERVTLLWPGVSRHDLRHESVSPTARLVDNRDTAVGALLLQVSEIDPFALGGYL